MEMEVIEERDTKFGKIQILHDPLRELLNLQTTNQITEEEATRRYTALYEAERRKTLSGWILSKLRPLVNPDR
ncbi:MAG: hypothetical protein SFV18_08700 [Bryobacteraceae bacterium]|nr:hypothetical protein [Bryobacteraceae bacterium]